MWKSKAQMGFIHERMYKDMTNIHEVMSSIYTDMDKRLKSLRDNGKKNTALEKQLLEVADAVCLIQDYKEMLMSTDKEYKTDVLEELETAKEEKARLEERVAILEQENKALKEQSQANNKELIDNYHSLLSSLNENMAKFNSRVDDAVKQIACKEYLSSDEFKHRDRKGDKAPRYRQDINNDDIINKYNQGISVKQIAETYGMTENGMRLRLKDLGVWKDRRFKHSN